METDARRRLKIRDWLVRVERCALEYGRKKSRRSNGSGPICGTPRGSGIATKAGKFWFSRPQRIADPSAGAGKTIQRESGAHLIFGRAVGVGLGGHRMDEAHFVRQLRQVRQHVRDHFAALPARLELPERLDQVAVLALKVTSLSLPGSGCPWRLINSGL